MAVGDQDAFDAHGLRGLHVVQRITDHDAFLRILVPHPFQGDVHLGACVDIVDPQDFVEIPGDLQFFQLFLQFYQTGGA